MRAVRTVHAVTRLEAQKKWNLSECHIWSLWSLLLAAISIETDWPLPAQVVGFRSDTQWYAATPQLKLFLASRLSSTSSLSFVFQCDQCTEYVILLIRYSLHIKYTKLMVYQYIICLSFFDVFATEFFPTSFVGPPLWDLAISGHDLCDRLNHLEITLSRTKWCNGITGVKMGNQIHVWQCLIWIASIDRMSFSFKCRIPRKGSGSFGAKGFNWS